MRRQPLWCGYSAPVIRQTCVLPYNGLPYSSQLSITARVLQHKYKKSACTIRSISYETEEGASLAYFLVKKEYDVLPDFPAQGTETLRLQTSQVKGPYAEQPSPLSAWAVQSEWHKSVHVEQLPSGIDPFTDLYPVTHIRYGIRSGMDILRHTYKVDVQQLGEVPTAVYTNLEATGIEWEQIADHLYRGVVDDDAIVELTSYERFMVPVVSLEVLSHSDKARYLLRTSGIIQLQHIIGVEDSRKVMNTVYNDGLAYTFAVDNSSIAELLEGENIIISGPPRPSIYV